MSQLADGAPPRPEIIVGLVGPVGVDLRMISELIRAQLRQYNYSVEPEISLSGLLEYIERHEPLVREPREDYVAARMDEGNRIRKVLGSNDALAEIACAQIYTRRRQLNERDNVEANRPRPALAWILRSLKHPEEVSSLRQIYGPRFVCIAAQAPRQVRIDHLASEIAASHGSTDREEYKARAQELAVRDEAEEVGHGQNVSKTFVTADCYVEATHRQEAQEQLERFFDAWFGKPYASPSRDEYAMFIAKGAAARAADLSRQVGASIVVDGSVVAIGCNEVPAFGGGMYWERDPSDARDFMRGYDANQRTRRIAVDEVRSRLIEAGWIDPSHRDDPASDFAAVLDGTRLDVLTEFGRPVHAEMAAILDAARRGVPLGGASLYCTTFPCHNCAKHLVGAGFDRVYFIEPYPKSLAEELHEDSVLIDPAGVDEPKLKFLPFVGVSPNMYIPIYERSGQRKNDDGTALEFDRPTARPKLVEGWDWTYLDREVLLIDELRKRMSQAGESMIGGRELPDVGDPDVQEEG